MKTANIVYRSVLDKYKDIDERNKQFDSLTDEGKRLEITWDVLKLLENEVILPAYGEYWSGKLQAVAFNTTTSKELFIRFNKDSVLQSCRVCARGALMLSQIRLGNTLSPNTYRIDRGGRDIIQGFSIEDFEEMENEYERSDYSHPYRANTREKLMNIMCNVLVNGNFNTSDDNDYLIDK